jgi:hypothetical protein
MAEHTDPRERAIEIVGDLNLDPIVKQINALAMAHAQQDGESVEEAYDALARQLRMVMRDAITAILEEVKRG